MQNKTGPFTFAEFVAFFTKKQYESINSLKEVSLLLTLATVHRVTFSFVCFCSFLFLAVQSYDHLPQNPDGVVLSTDISKMLTHIAAEHELSVDLALLAKSVGVFLYLFFVFLSSLLSSPLLFFASLASCPSKDTTTI